MDNSDGLTIDDVIEDDELTRAVYRVQALLAPCQVECTPASPDRIRTVLRERYDEGFIDLVLSLMTHYRPSTSSWRQ